MGTATGIIKALNSGVKHLAVKRFTLRYPEQKLKFVGDGYQFDPSSGVAIAGLKGRHMLFHDHCTGCQLCSIACEGVAAAFVALIPVAPGGWVVADLDVGLLAVFAVIGFFPIITILSAWSANSKFPFIGGIRALHQMVSFEIPLILSLLGVVILTGTLNLSEIVESQSSFPWIIFMPIGAIVFFTTMLAELERIPFDLPEAESEIVAGWLTEFSGMMYGLVQLGSYLKLYAFAALFVIIFLGGWTGPVFWPPLETDLITKGTPISLKSTGSESVVIVLIPESMMIAPSARIVINIKPIPANFLFGSSIFLNISSRFTSITVNKIRTAIEPT